MATLLSNRLNALRAIARRRDLPEGDVAALMEYVAATVCHRTHIYQDGREIYHN